MSVEHWYYRAFGLRWQSALPLPELRDDPNPGDVDVVVEFGVAPAPSDAETVVPGVLAATGKFWMEVPDIARFLVTDGRRIVVEPKSINADDGIRIFLLGSAVGALLHQRDLIPLHASAIELGGRAVAFVAPSGGGKSTIAMHLHHLGNRVIADDLCAIAVTDGVARVWPGLKNLKLWRSSLKAMDREPDRFEPIFGAMDKYRVPIKAIAEDRPYDLAAIVRLNWGETSVLKRVSGAEAVGVLIANTFRGQLVRSMQRDAAHWQQCIDLFRACGVFQLTRPRALDQLNDASALIIERFSPSGNPTMN